MTEETTDKQRTSREISNANLTPFKPGESGNPKGRPKDADYITTHLKRLLNEKGAEGKTNAELIAQAMIDAAIDQGNRGAAAILAQTLDRVEGKVKETIEVEGGSVSINFIPARKEGSQDASE